MFVASEENSLPECIRKCSTTGPSESAGKNVSAAISTTVPTNKPTNSGPCVGNVPLVTGVFFLAARLPPIAISGIINRNRPISVASPVVRLYQGVFTLMPAKALPLFSVALVYAYRISVNPWGPLLPKFAVAGTLAVGAGLGFPEAGFQYWDL